MHIPHTGTQQVLIFVMTRTNYDCEMTNCERPSMKHLMSHHVRALNPRNTMVVTLRLANNTYLSMPPFIIFVALRIHPARTIHSAAWRQSESFQPVLDRALSLLWIAILMAPQPPTSPSICMRNSFFITHPSVVQLGIQMLLTRLLLA